MCTMQVQQDKVLDTVPPRGPTHEYDPECYDPTYDYGGYANGGGGFGGRGGRGGGRNSFS